MLDDLFIIAIFYIVFTIWFVIPIAIYEKVNAGMSLTDSRCRMKGEKGNGKKYYRKFNDARFNSFC